MNPTLSEAGLDALALVREELDQVEAALRDGATAGSAAVDAIGRHL